MSAGVWREEEKEDTEDTETEKVVVDDMCIVAVLVVLDV